jgi:hypothetical protein
MLRKIQALGLALVAMAALSAFASAAASALTFELALWLFNGSDIVNPVLVTSVGELLFLNVLNGAIIHCHGQFEGFVENESKDQITMVWNLELTHLIEELVGAAIECESLAVCDAGSALIWPIKLPWRTEVEQDPEGPTFWELTFGAAYHIECTVFGIPTVEECVAAEGTAAEILNVTGGVETMGVATPLATCNNNAEEGEIEAEVGNLTSSGEGTISASLNASKE